MTREEFNKLPKQERINLAWDRCKHLFSVSDDNKTRNIIHRYARLSDSDEWTLACTSSYQSDWLGKTANKFFGTGYHAIIIALEHDRKCFAKRTTRNDVVVINNEDVQDEFLESVMFDEIPNGETKEEYLDKFDSLAFLFPQAVYEMSKRIPMDMSEYIEKSREKGEWLEPKKKSISRICEVYNNPKTLTKVNIALICIAGLITIINILVFL